MFLIQKSGESRVQPGTLNNLSKFALTLLIVVLVVITLLNVRERKYEIGVLTEIGADKVKVAAQFGRDMQGVVGRFAPLISPRIRHVMNLAGRVWGFCTSMKDMHSLRVCLTAFDWFANIGSLH
ncbi:permease of ABC transporter system [Bifidobacterium pseudocatenulatum]|uniref:FtsX-like permease family protein n=1 Tax=Bifidobacterium pseudocatenulatum TaxID=28026 RepID=UPI0009EFE7FC|nr:FtsX-like permease family protein [Bifidobacterium pseudocatenulatum]OQM54563.1 permease of ABC transporter system [Bifidobacterium pseudocatenulatum]